MSLSKRSSLALVLPALALTFATACGAAAPPTAPPTLAPAATAAPTQAPAPTAAPTTSPAPTGTPYHVDVPESLWGAWQASISNNTNVSNGLWSMTIIENEISVLNPKAQDASETFALGVTDITADHVTFWADPECQAGDIHKEGTYTYAVVADQLVFTLIEDDCRDRAALLTAAPWERPA
ncbi:MAG: hypothetical protein QOJ81_1959 [Chloroflexota bacterium]|jgi:hypothetical protein|nr:hypothetical protein [Chloroflexota bacterium]